MGGGTSLPAQSAALELMGLRGSARDGTPGSHAQQLARVVAGAVLAGELSLMSALTSNDLLSAHIKLNRKAPATAAAPPVTPIGGAAPLPSAAAAAVAADAASASPTQGTIASSAFLTSRQLAFLHELGVDVAAASAHKGPEGGDSDSA